MLSPADKRRHLVLVIQPLSSPRERLISVQRNKPGPVAAGGGVCLSNPPTTTLPSAIPGVSYQASRPPPPSTDTDKDPHNEVERRRKLRISRNIKTLAETLTPPCHCGKTTRADVLTRVVEQIKELQKKNSELQTKIEELQKPTNGEELSRQAVELIEENLRLRSLLLSSVGHKESQSLGSGEESQKVGGTSEELEDGAATTGKEESEREAPPAPSSSSSSSQADRENTGEKENEDVQEEETVGNASKEDGATRGSATEQLWPISSLLSDESRAGPREHNLPILSPTYIAEHCSTSSCETHFFPSPVSSPPITSVTSSVGTSTSAPLCSYVPPATETLTVISTGSIPSTSSRPVSCTSSVSHTALYPPHPTPPYPSPTTSQSIVQPWIGSPTSRNENAAIHSSVTVQQSQPLQATVRKTGRQPVHHVQLHGYQHSVASMVHCTNHQQHMYAPRPSHSARPRVGLHTHTPQYTSTGEHYTADNSTPPRVYSSRTHRDLRGHCPENLSSYLSTGPTFQLCGGSVSPAVLLQTPSFSNVSTDHYFHHSVQPMHNLPSLQSHHQLHTQHNLHSHPSAHNISHHPHPHHHNYPLPPHPHQPTPSFTPHPHHPPSHHSTVWRPYSDRQRTATRFNLSNILSPSLTSSPPLGLPTHISPSVHQSQGGRIPSFFVDHLLDDL